jgi:hypothetical protein
MAFTTAANFADFTRSKRVTIGDHVLIAGEKAHVVSIGRKYVEVLFYAGQSARGRMKVDPLSEMIVWTGTAHC